MHTSAAPSAPSWFANLVNKIETTAESLFSNIKKVEAEVGPIVITYGEEFLGSLAEIAVGAVMKQVPLEMAGSEKFGNAVASVIQQVEAKDQALAVQDAQAAVQAAYNKVKQLANS